MLVVEAKWEARGTACTELLCRKGVQEGGSTGLGGGQQAERGGREGGGVDLEGERCCGGGPRSQDKKLCVYPWSYGAVEGLEAKRRLDQICLSVSTLAASG